MRGLNRRSATAVPRAHRSRSLRNVMRLVVVAAIGLLTMQFVGVSGSQASNGVPPAIPPPGSAYLGAWVQPMAQGTNNSYGSRVELGNLDTFNGNLGRPLGLVHVYVPWGQPIPLSVLSAIASTGAVPVVDVSCAPGTVSQPGDAMIAQGMLNSTIDGYASQLSSYAKPVFFRWFKEMNLIHNVGNSLCLGTTNVAQAGLGFVQAWDEMYLRFQSQSFSTSNVSFVWNPSAGAAGPISTFSAFWPSVANGAPSDGYGVSWMGFDDYYRAPSPDSNPTQSIAALITQVQGAYATELALPGASALPLMWGETGAYADQSQYLQTLVTTLPTMWPDIKALLYFDASSDKDWTLYNVSGDLGVDAFAALANSPYFEYPFNG